MIYSTSRSETEVERAFLRRWKLQRNAWEIRRKTVRQNSSRAINIIAFRFARGEANDRRWGTSHELDVGF